MNLKIVEPGHGTIVHGAVMLTHNQGTCMHGIFESPTWDEAYLLEPKIAHVGISQPHFGVRLVRIFRPGELMD